MAWEVKFPTLAQKKEFAPRVNALQYDHAYGRLSLAPPLDKCTFGPQNQYQKERRTMHRRNVFWPLLLVVTLLAACMPIQPTSALPVKLENGVVGTVNQPSGAGPQQPAPAVLMLHGFGSQKDEVGNMYARAADALAAQGVGSLRIDFSGFGKSDGDTGASTVGGQIADAEAAYNWLAAQSWVDPARIGVLGFSLGGGIAIMTAGAHPDWFKSMATWSSVGNFNADFSGPPYDEARIVAAENGIVGMDLGWRTIALKNDFFATMKDYDIADAITQHLGAYLAVAGDQDFSAAYAPGLVEAAPGAPTEAWIIPGGDHTFLVLTEDQTMAEEVIQRTADWFAQTLGAVQ
jgi:dienelactone hydrolase